MNDRRRITSSRFATNRVPLALALVALCGAALASLPCGGAGACEEGPESTRCCGATGSITRAHLRQGEVPRVATGQSREKREHRVIPIRPMTEDVEVLYGDPEKEGEPFVMRIRELPGTIIPPHRHPVDEHLTVVQGTIYFAVSEKFDRAALKEIKAGGYAFIPAGSTMFGYIPDGAIVQVHGTGPFHIYWRAGANWHRGHQTLDDPAAASRFKFRKGERVVSKRGRGRVRQAYFSGEILQYEVEKEDGALYMALEEELRRG